MEQGNACRWQHQNIMALNRPTFGQYAMHSIAKSGRLQKQLASLSKKNPIQNISERLNCRVRVQAEQKKMVFNEKENGKNKLNACECIHRKFVSTHWALDMPMFCVHDILYASKRLYACVRIAVYHFTHIDDVCPMFA